MTIETKHEIYDTIYFISNKKVASSKVRGIKIEIMANPIEIEPVVTYLCNDDEDARVNIKIEEKDAFPTKEELIESL